MPWMWSKDSLDRAIWRLVLSLYATVLNNEEGVCGPPLGHSVKQEREMFVFTIIGVLTVAALCFLGLASVLEGISSL